MSILRISLVVPVSILSVGLLIGILGCQEVDMAEAIEKLDLPLEVWDFSEGMVVSGANWGTEGWETATEIADSQFKGPVYLRILLPEGRAIEGKFSVVRATREGGVVDHVSLKLPPSSAESAYGQAMKWLGSFGSLPDGSRLRLDQWLTSGPASGPGEQLNFNVSNPHPEVARFGIGIDWVWSRAAEGKWAVGVSLVSSRSSLFEELAD